MISYIALEQPGKQLIPDIPPDSSYARIDRPDLDSTHSVIFVQGVGAGQTKHDKDEVGHVVLTYHAFILELVSTLRHHCPEECHQKSLKYIGHGGLNWLCRLFMVSRETEWSRSLVPGYLVLFSLQLPERKSQSEWSANLAYRFAYSWNGTIHIGVYRI